MDGVEQLTEEHTRLDERIAQLRSLGFGPSEHKATEVEQLAAAFEEHAGVEESVFYPVVSYLVPETIVAKLAAEHHQVDLLVMDLAAVSIGSRTGDARLTVLLETMVRHLRHEEALLLTPAAEGLTSRERREIAVAMAAFRQGDPRPLQLVGGHPHPTAPGVRRTLSGRLLGQIGIRRDARRGHLGPSTLGPGEVVQPSRPADEHGLIEYPANEVVFADGRPKAVGSQELYSPTTYQQTDTGFWGLYPAGDDVVAVHPWGAMQGPPLVVAEALVDVAAVTRREEDRNAVAVLRAFLGPAGTEPPADPSAEPKGPGAVVPAD